MRAQRRTVTATAILAAAGLAVTTLAAGPASADKPDDPAKMAKAVRVEAVNAHLKAFQRIADRNDGNRGAVYNNTDGALNGTLGGPADDYAPITPDAAA